MYCPWQGKLETKSRLNCLYLCPVQHFREGHYSSRMICLRVLILEDLIGCVGYENKSVNY